eukprot:CAMPEP_0194151992 /NCGR_PEP_ID=MMETSP0152-20130528/50465_1 /TAXON_ID=1049557 /ORGANISM="Thalassiothrix antarctica, Strain L6-D1" /LENGTH=217 /DNA_ID=CAMNT_0038856181 /DNA_START=57 /DNA_END=710 /DNA_ORIENTATION=-
MKLILSQLEIFALSSILIIQLCNGWITSSSIPTIRPSIFSLNVLPDNYEEEGNKIIFDAAEACGASQDQISVEWLSGKIIVTIDGNVFLADGEDDDVPKGVVDVTTLAKSINAAFKGEESDDESVEASIGSRIAESFAIEVSTPGAPDEISGIMWEAYQGFDVIAEFLDVKKNETKIVEARLKERTEDTTIINIKGRMKEIKNEDIISVKLPKAMKE